MENPELKLIKKIYGENLAHLCRDLFPTILEQEGVLTKILKHSFAPTFSLYDDLILNDMTEEFKNFVYSFVDIQKSKLISTNKSPKELLNEAGYILYPECKNEEQIQQFKKYYAPNEELCTFKGQRLNTARVWFAVKKNIQEINRKDFINPRRQDEYGTSVISIQFTKGEKSTVSIKNRYNHMVSNPDATFGNNLENIIPGLTKAFMDTYHIKLLNEGAINFELPNYFKSEDGKFYRYNLCLHSCIYCENNVLFENNKINILDKSSKILIDNYILDLKEKIIKPYKKFSNEQDEFVKSIGNIKTVSIVKDGIENKKIIVKNDSTYPIEIKINKHNEIIGYKNQNIENIGDNFLENNRTLKELELPNLQTVGNLFLYSNRVLKTINVPNLKVIKNGFLLFNQNLKSFNAPSLEEIGDSFLSSNLMIKNLDFPQIKTIKNNFMTENELMESFSAPKLISIGHSFCENNKKLTKLDVPNLEIICENFLYGNNEVVTLEFPKLKHIGNYFMYNNKSLKDLNIPSITTIGSYFLCHNDRLNNFIAPQLQYIENCFMPSNVIFKNFNAPSLTKIGEKFLMNNNTIENFYVPNLKKIGVDYLINNKKRKLLKKVKIFQETNEREEK